MKIPQFARRVVVCFSIFALLFAPAVAQAEDKKTPNTEQGSAGKKVKRRSYKGTIETIDASSKTVTLKKARSSKTFKIADDAKCVTTFNTNATPNDLKPGDLVNVRFTQEGETAIAHRIAPATQKPSADDAE